jgi:hypothetical protein
MSALAMIAGRLHGDVVTKPTRNGGQVAFFKLRVVTDPRSSGGAAPPSRRRRVRSSTGSAKATRFPLSACFAPRHSSTTAKRASR